LRIGVGGGGSGVRSSAAPPASSWVGISFMLPWQYLTRRRAQVIHSFATIMIACYEFPLIVGRDNIPEPPFSLAI